MIPLPPKGVIPQDERGAALISALLILLLLTVLASGGYWLSRGEMAAGQGYSQGVRALYLAETGLARYFASTSSPAVTDLVFEVYPDPCADTILYPTPALQSDCYYALDGAEGDELLEELAIDPAPPQAYAFTNAMVYVTAEFVLTDGQAPIYEVTSEARVQDVSDPDLWTTRAVSQYADVSPPFSITSVFAATGGVNFAGGNDDHYHFDGAAVSGKTGSCGSDIDMDNIEIPKGQFSLPKPSSACPGGKECPYKWHQLGTALEVDSLSLTGTGIVNGMGISWSDFLDGSYYTGVSNVVTFNDSNLFEDYFDKSKDKAFKASTSWPITRFFGDLTSDKDVKGYGLLVVDGDLNVTNNKLEWTGIILAGGTINTSGSAHIHVKGAAVAGLSCTEAERAAGSCRSQLNGDHNDMKYRPCEISQAWSRLLQLRPMDDLFRESGPVG